MPSHCVSDFSFLSGARDVGIAVENVWNDFLLSPLEFARYVDPEFGSVKHFFGPFRP